jgi:hypothetical protein
MEDDRCSVLENSPVPRHFIMREEELFKIGVLHIKCLSTLLHQGVECRLEDIALVKVGSTVVGVFTLHA